MPLRHEDEEILAAVRALQKRFHPDVFGVIYRRYYRSIFQFFANRPDLREEADDLTQTTLLRAFEKIDQFRFQGSFHAWLRGIAENVWKNAWHARQTIKRGPPLEPLEPADESAHAPAPVRDVFGHEAPTPEQLALKEERTRVLRRAIEALPTGMRRCIELRLFADLQYQEISDLTGIGLGSVRSQLFEARQRLKPVLDEYFQGADF